MKNFMNADINSPVDMTLKMLDMLSDKEREQVLKHGRIISNRKTLRADTFSDLAFNEDVSPVLYIDALHCPRCGSQNFVKNGNSQSNSQRYKCKDCLKTFSASTNTLSSHSKQDVGQWMQFVLGLLNNEPYKRIAEDCGISITTALAWRLKVFAALEQLSKEIVLSNIVFADDTRVPYNFKGNHGEGFIAPRASRSRGGQNTMKTVQRNTICILCAIDTAGRSFSHCIGFGNPSGKRLSNGFLNKLNVDENTVLVTDGAQSFKRVVDDYGIAHWERKVSIKKNGKHFPNVQGQFHIQAINSYHSRLKSFLAPFRGVASRYLPGYLLLFDYKENNKHLSLKEQARKILEAMVNTPDTMTAEMLERKYQIPVSNGPESELWEAKIPRKEQKIYIEWYNKMPIKDICEKYGIKARKIYTIKDKVDKYGVHDNIINPPKKHRTSTPGPISKKSWEVFLCCYRDGCSYAEAGRRFGISRQRAQQITNSILKRPESATVKRFEPVMRKRKPEPLLQPQQTYREFKLIHFQGSPLKETYNILAMMHNSTPRHVGTFLYKQRLLVGDTQVKHHWTPERKTMEGQEYYIYLCKRNRQIYADALTCEKKHPHLSRTKIFTQLAEKYALSASRISSIFYEVKSGNLPQFHPERHLHVPQKQRIYNAVLEEMHKHPGFSNNEYFRRIASTHGMTKRSVENYFYDYRKLMRQAQNPESGQFDEAV